MSSKPSDSAINSDSSASTGCVLGVNHIGLAPKDPDKARWFFHTALGLPEIGEELVVQQHTLTIMLSAFSTPPSPPVERLEILVPSPPGQGAVGKFLEKRGSGIHHLALTVRNLEALITRLINLGVQMIDTVPRAGAHHTRIAFVHPESTGGLLVELVQPEV